MSTDALPIGQSEGQELELKSRDALDSLEGIGREAVAMLNAGSAGAIWIGIPEDRGVASAPEPIENVDRAVRRLTDYLMDAIEPPPLAGEIEVDPVAIDNGEAVIRVRIRAKGGRGPFALLKRGTRLFVVRNGDRLRPMTREEIATGFRSPQTASTLGASGQGTAADVFQSLAKESNRLRAKAVARKGFFWFAVQPAEAGSIDLQKLRESGYLTEAVKSDNRVAGFNFAAASDYGDLTPEFERRHGATWLTLGREDIMMTAVSRTGALRFEAPLSTFYRPLPIAELRERLILYPVALVEYPTSVLRLAAALYADTDLWESSLRPEANVVVHLAMLGLRGWHLAPGSPDQLWPRRGLLREYEEMDFELDRPLLVTVRDLTGRQADRVAFRVLREVYEGFGFLENQMPREFDPATRRLVLPE